VTEGLLLHVHANIDLGGGSGGCPGWWFQLCSFLDGYYQKSHGCYKTMMGVIIALLKNRVM